jgi:hypothetical protein
MHLASIRFWFGFHGHEGHRPVQEGPLFHHGGLYWLAIAAQPG